MAAVTGLGGCETTSTHSVQTLPVSQNQGYSQTATIDASWSVNYKDLKSLKAASTVVVEGKITAVAGETLDTATHIPFTDFTLSVDKAVYDPHGHVHGFRVIVHQTGGIVNNTLFQVDDDPLFQVGEQVVLFLHEYAPDMYFVVGGPTGRFEVRSGKVSAGGSTGVTLPSSTSLDAFLAQVNAA